MERRDFIKQTAALASITAVGGISHARPVSAIPQSNASRCLIGAVLVDERFSDSRRFASIYSTHGARVISLAADIGALWYGELRTQCSQVGGVIAGLTLHTDLFISQQFARECGKKFIQFGVHDCRGRSTLTHSIPANAALDLRACESWAAEVANCMIKTHAFTAQQATQSTGIARSSDHPGSLYSWMIV